MSRTNKIVAVILAALLALCVGTAILFRHAIGHSIALHEGLAAVANHTAAPVDLNDAIASYGMPAAHFARVTDFPAWRTMPTGFQVYDHVPFQIDGAMFLWGAANAHQLHIIFPEQIPDIPVNQKFQTLYLLHDCFFNSARGTPVYQVVFHYQDDAVSPATNTILFGDDTLDWSVGRAKKHISPIGPRSRLAWIGGSWSPKIKTPLRMCLTAITNPAPDFSVTSIDFYSCKNQSAGCIFAITTGQAGLMK